jgi:2,4-dienoyl-CoA reductase-like NADH-dependent reductase (Old Yellow Enzyme family)
MGGERVAKFERLFSPITVGGIEIRNRLLQTGHTKAYAEKGMETERDLAYYVERARGGLGLIVTGFRMVHPTSTVEVHGFAKGYLREAVAFDRQITEAVHATGTKIVLQLNHIGTNGSSESEDGSGVLWAPSSVKSPVFGEVPKEMEDSDIVELCGAFALAAELGRAGGYDGVEVHLAHSFLLHQFLSPLYNMRRDAYGGSREARVRICLEVLSAIRQRVGRDYVVGARLPLGDGVQGGIDIGEAIEIARLIEASGFVDYFNVTLGGYHDRLSLAIAPSDMPDGWLLGLIAELKRAVATPVFAVGGIKSAAHAEQVLTAGIADMVAVTRAVIADPEFPRKVAEGRENETYRCIRCNQGCISRPIRGLPISCTINPVVGRELQWGGVLPPAARRERWLVIGGGPAGMKAAETAARRGHAVTLVEQAKELGGQVRLIARSVGRESFGLLIQDLEEHLRLLGVEVHLGTSAAAADVRAIAPDRLVLATGALPDRTGFSSVAPLVESLPGADRDNVLTGWDVIGGMAPEKGHTVVLDDDGSRYTASVVEALRAGGCRVTLVSHFSSLLPYTKDTLEQPVIYKRLLGDGLDYCLNSWASAVQESLVQIYDVYTGHRRVVADVDSVILCGRSLPNDALYHELTANGIAVVRIGDCLAPRKLDHAIFEGYQVGREEWRTSPLTAVAPGSSSLTTL